MRKGFTLVELSIVLVIIGLLIGGILVARSMIETAKIQRLVRDLAKYEVSINNFKLNYKNPPGDSPYFIPAGDGNNTFGYGAAGPVTCSGIYRNYEYYQAFAHLSQAHMVDTNYMPYTPIVCGGSMNDYENSSSVAGIAFPYTEVDSTAAAALNIGGRKNSIVPGLLVSNSFVLNVYVSVSYVIPLEAKLGYVNWNSTPFPVGYRGFASWFAAGWCNSSEIDAYACDDSRVKFGHLSYYIPPI